MRPDFKVAIYDWHDELYPVRLVTLATWRSLLALAVKTNSNPKKICTIVRKELRAPKSYSKSDLYAHINTSYLQIMEKIENEQSA
jgi:hypothetical protein